MSNRFLESVVEKKGKESLFLDKREVILQQTTFTSDGLLIFEEMRPPPKKKIQDRNLCLSPFDSYTLLIMRLTTWMMNVRIYTRRNRGDSKYPYNLVEKGREDSTGSLEYLSPYNSPQKDRILEKKGYGVCQKIGFEDTL